MAMISPSALPSLRHDGGLYRELDVLARLKASLPDEYEIFHGVNWHSVHEGQDRHGEIDIVVLGPSGNLLLMEIKAGQVAMRNGEIFKLYAHKELNVAAQLRIQYAAMINRLKQAGLHPVVSNCLVLPDYVLQSSPSIAFPRERIIDANDYDALGSWVVQIMRSDQPSCDQVALRRFLCNEFCVMPDLAVLRDQLRTSSARLADGMATWVPRIQAPSRTIRIQATAGSGKTQLALKLLDDAVANGQKCLYVCYNRPLADYISGIASPHAKISNFHDLCVEHYQRRHGEPDFSAPAVFQEVVDVYAADSAQFPQKYDLLLIDEGQDFEPDWVQALLGQLKDDGRFYLLEDPDQRLYQRDEFDLLDAVQICCSENFRSPHMICQMIDALALASTPIQSRGVYQGEPPEVYVYSTEKQLLNQTAAAVQQLLDSGFALEDIVVLTGHGLSKSVILQAEKIGAFSTRRFTGRFSERTGLPEWSDGRLKIESIYRYKGQSSPAVILAELDFVEMTLQERKKLFVGLTRASMALSLVVSTEAERCIATALA